MLPHSYISDRELSEIAETLSPEYRQLRQEEHGTLKKLNTRFAAYIERVRFLEQQNKLLEAQLRQVSVKYESRLGDIYQAELRRLRAHFEAQNMDKVRLEQEVEKMIVDVQEMNQEHLDSLQDREDLDRELKNLRDNVDDCTEIKEIFD